MRFAAAAAVVVLGCLAVAATGTAGPEDFATRAKSIIDAVNSAGTTWKAGVNENFSGKNMTQIRRMMGVKKDPSISLRVVKHEGVNVPTNFDARDQWPGCIGNVMNQAECGSCWAFGAAESASDRMCIETKQPYLQLAPLDLVTCDDNDNGCDGGDPSSAWNYMSQSGMVTEACYPYLQSEGGPVPTCPAAQQPCLNFINTPSCTRTCHNGASWSSTKHFVQNVYGINWDADSMRSEVVQNGPFEVTMTVYEDFLSYKSGVYQHTTGQPLGGHAIKLIGYGQTSDGTQYFLCQNSWTSTWGDKGYFMIGVDWLDMGGVAGTGFSSV